MSDQFIKLEDIASRFHKPCILDVKVGRRVWDDFAERDKIERERKKYPLQEILGFRIIGMRVSWNGMKLTESRDVSFLTHDDLYLRNWF